MTLKKIIVIHQTLPVLNSQFLHMLVSSYVTLRQNRTFSPSYELMIFNLNISLAQLPKMSSPALIDAYETAFALELTDKEPFSVHLLIEFFGRNLYFVQFGFYQGFGELLFNTIVCDPRANSDVWIVSVLLKLKSFGISDPQYMARVRQMVEANFEQYAQNALVKFAILVLTQSTSNARHNETLIRKLRYFNPENITDVRILTQLILCIA